MKSAFLYVIYASVFLLHPGDGHRILGIFPLGAKSHFTYNNAIMKSLIGSGHEVTVITSFPQQASAENYTSVIDVSEKNLMFVGQTTFDEFASQNVFKALDRVIGIELPYCSKIVKLPEIQKILNSDEKFYDVVFVEIILFYRCFLPVAEKMNTPVIGTVAPRIKLIADYAIHNPNHPACIPYELIIQKWNLDNIFGRVINALNHIVVLWYKNFVASKMLKQFHNDHIDQLNSLRKYMDMEPDLIFYNSHASVLSRPMNPNAIDIGGIHLEDTKALPKNILKFIEEADHGVILFTLGSFVRAATLSIENQVAFRDAFAEIPQRVIWKFEEKMENLSDNVMILEWLAQRDILEHKNVIAFISHCGLGGMNEAIHTATPIVACPLFSDQPDNAKLLENLEVAVRLDIYNITKENVLNALNAIINDSRYYNNMQNLSKKFKDRPMTPQQSVIYWTEYVIRHHGASHLRSAASHLSWYQFLLLDVITTVTAVLSIFLYLLNRTFRMLSSQCTPFRFINMFTRLKNKKL